MAHRVTLIPGDGIGPELAEATRRVLEASGVGFDWEVQEAGEAMIAEHGTPLPEAVLESIRRNKVALKGPITTPVGGGFRSANVTLRQALGLYANLRPARSMKGLETRYEDVDLVIVRENTEDLYAGIEHMVGPDAAESIKIITRAASERIARYAFDYAVANGRRKVTAVHKANIMKLSDGLFLECFYNQAKLFPDIAGQGIANPTALMLSAVQMLNHIGERDAANRMRDAILAVFAEGQTITRDLGGTAKTNEFARAIEEKIKTGASATA